MLARRVRVCSRPWQACRRRGILRSPAARCFTTASPKYTATPPLSSHAPSPHFISLTADLDQLAPRIEIEPEQVEVIDGPSEFYKTLKNKIARAKTRIFLSTLYIGKSEHELIECLREALIRNGVKFRVSILTDALRGTRESPSPSCASLLASLVEQFPDQVDIRMYHTPNLNGIKKALVPKRINEGWGLQHMKLYGVDDEIILSGANLSNDYFTNRQDRYHLFSSKRVTDYYYNIHHAVCQLSLQLQETNNASGYTLVWPESNPGAHPLEDTEAFLETAYNLLESSITPQSDLSAAGDFPKSQSRSSASSRTYLYPLLVHPPVLNNELAVLTTLFRRPQQPLHSYTFTAGYFNPHPAVTSALIAASSPSPSPSPASSSPSLPNPSGVSGKVLTASPYANGFHNSQGISGMLPAAYTHLFHQFFSRATAAKCNMQLREWRRGTVGEPGGWTYHAKGIWITLPPSTPPSSSSSPLSSPVSAAKLAKQDQSKDQDQEQDQALPSATLIGSSNYTTRSYTLDLEVGALVISDDATLQRKWAREERNLSKYATGKEAEVTEELLSSRERRASWRVRVAMWVVRLVGGSL